ncbi:hypothetical protein ARAM_001485 [Aspergillus rambellii]|uniref:Initiation-specific alpha-1,6-mannosyltransferase n=1 Tax=Aspergillus rambellii TaxID=308745 RepID=A0A0F8UH23_9EURO|nr:hypothetical protein ARAM_001485 [Aspergillus rambellii]
MGTLFMSPSRYVAAIVVFLLIFNMYLFNRVIRLTTQNEEFCDTSLHTSPPIAAVTTSPTTVDPLPKPVTVTVTNIVTTTTTVTPNDTPANPPVKGHGSSSSSSSSSSLSVQNPATAAIPAKIWHKCGHKGVNDDARKLIDQWLEKNPNFRHEVLTDESGDQYVREHYADWPEVVDTFMALTVPILKADFLRVLIMYADGGIWSDLDVACEVPVSEWIPKKLANDPLHPINVVVGIEFDGWQFASWTVMAKPRLAHFERTIRYVLDQIQKLAADNHVSIPAITKPMIPDVVAVTGPQAITIALLQSVSAATGQDIQKQAILNLKEPTLIGDILVLPQAAFAALQGGFPKDQGPYLVSHHYSGSWKNDVGGEEGVKPPSS